MSKRTVIRVVQVDEGTEDVNKIMSRLVSVHLTQPQTKEEEFYESIGDRDDLSDLGNGVA